ncbi:helix-turn-helix domain-containing protein [Paenibacillus taichungensis]
MHMNPGINEQNLLLGLKSILDTAELKTYEKMIMVVIKVFQAEYGDVFPDYDTIAAAGGMSKRKAQYVVKDLVTRNILEKAPRFKELPDGTRKQTSNRYKAVELSSTVPDGKITSPDKDAPDASVDSFCASHAPYKAGFINQDSLGLYPSTEKNKEEEEYITRTREIESTKYACYADVYEKMVKFQGTGVLCFHQSEFLECSKIFRLPSCIVSELYPHIELAIQQYHYDSISRTIEKFAERIHKKRIDNPISWFVATFRNENLKVRMEIEMARIGKVS